MRIIKEGIPGSVCGYEWSLVRQYKGQLYEALASGKLDEALKNLELLVQQQKWIEEELKPKPLKIEGLAEDLELMKKRIAKLEAERDQLLDTQAKVKAP